MDAHPAFLAQVSGIAEQGARLGEEVADGSSDQGLTILLFVIGGALLIGLLTFAIKYHIDTN